KGRVCIVNVWRPIRHKPLAVSDSRTLDATHDFVPVRLIFPDREGGVFGVCYNPDHKWYYLSSQTPDDATFIKCYDSKEDRARLTPHSAFLDATRPPEAPHRESVDHEVRALRFSDWAGRGVGIDCCNCLFGCVISV
ncbi:hypothetical protein B0H21DRAFT_698470, partial [Amylocystis lapponica]